MVDMESLHKKAKTSSTTFDAQDDFVPLGNDNEQTFATTEGNLPFIRLSSGGRPDDSSRLTRYGHGRPVDSRSNDQRYQPDRPKSKHALPGYEPWILVKTKLRRRFLHNEETKESFWRIPANILPGVLDFERRERDQKEKADNAKWAEDELQKMRAQSNAAKVNKAADEEGRDRRRRSESLQREDEEALMAELAAQAERGEEEDVKEAVKRTEGLQPHQGEVSYDSDSSYEEVEVTDSEFEEDGEDAQLNTKKNEPSKVEKAAEDGPMEFGEDDIAYQLAAMDDQHEFDPGEYGEDQEAGEGTHGFELDEEDAANLFRDLLDDHGVSPFTPWDKLIADESETGILNDDRYTVLNTMRARKDVWDSWARDKAAELKRIRAMMEKQDPKIPYLSFLHDKATPKLYWPEFKRKYKREPEMNERRLSDKEREKLYREHVNRLKLPERTLKADLHALLKILPPKSFNSTTTLDSLPQPLLSHLHYISLPASVRDQIVKSVIKDLPEPPEDGDMTAEEQHELDRKREERRRREKAMAERERKVEEDRRKNEKDLARAKRDLRDEEREIQRAMVVNRRGLKSHIINSS